MKNIDLVNELFEKFDNKIYLVGGSTRDYLLYKDYDDIDMVTSYLPNEVITILGISNYDKFAIKFGTVKTKLYGINIEITTLRKEGKYKDSRHPSNVRFIKSKLIDSKRRDFTINALYMDKHNHLYDYNHGLYDLKHKIIRVIGNTNKRIKEDPLRMIRAIRFSVNLGFKLNHKLEKIIIQNKDLINSISKEKLTQELSKVKDINKFNEELVKYNLKDLFDNKISSK